MFRNTIKKEQMEGNKRKNMCPTQREHLIDFLEEHPELKNGKFSASFTYKDASKLWMLLADTLNAIPGGANRDWKGWRKVCIVPCTFCNSCLVI